MSLGSQYDKYVSLSASRENTTSTLNNQIENSSADVPVNRDRTSVADEFKVSHLLSLHSRQNQLMQSLSETLVYVDCKKLKRFLSSTKVKT